jgi:polyisoprenyl-phosphate glycosyltransferase
MDRKVVDLLNAMPERNRYVRGLRAWLGFRQTAILFERPVRFAGQIKYSFRRLVGLGGWASTIVVVLFLGEAFGSI